MIPAPLRIGSLTVDFPVLLAPMAGYTDAVMRMLARRYHCGMAFTEMANAEGIVRGSKPTFHILATAPGERPIAAHLYGTNPETFARAAFILEQTGRFQAIDINCGCPASKIMARGSGAALMKHPDKIAQIVRAIKQAVSLPVTVKTRLGLASSHMNISEIAHAVEESGGSAITIHARFASGRHAGAADWPALAQVKSERAIPVIGNGGVASADDVRRMFAETGVDGVMIGKMAIGNPWIFQEAWSLLHGHTAPAHSVGEHRALIRDHLHLLIVHKEKALLAKRPRACPGGALPRSLVGAERAAVLHFRAHLAGYIKGFEKSAALRLRIQSLQRVEDILAALDELRN